LVCTSVEGVALPRSSSLSSFQECLRQPRSTTHQAGVGTSEFSALSIKKKKTKTQQIHTTPKRESQTEDFPRCRFFSFNTGGEWAGKDLQTEAIASLPVDCRFSEATAGSLPPVRGGPRGAGSEAIRERLRKDQVALFGAPRLERSRTSTS